MGTILIILFFSFIFYKLWKSIFGRNSSTNNNKKTTSPSKNIFIKKVSFSGTNPSFWEYKVDGKFISYSSHGGTGALMYNLNITFNEDGAVYYKSQDESNFHYLGKVNDFVQQYSRFPGENILFLKPN